MYVHIVDDIIDYISLDISKPLSICDLPCYKKYYQVLIFVLIDIITNILIEISDLIETYKNSNFF